MSAPAPAAAEWAGLATIRAEETDTVIATGHRP